MTLTQAMETPFRKTTYTEQEEEQIRKRVEESVKQKIDAMSPVRGKQETVEVNNQTFKVDSLDTVQQKNNLQAQKAVELSIPLLEKQEENTEPLNTTPFANKNYSYKDVENFAEEQDMSMEQANENAIKLIKENPVGTLAQNTATTNSKIWKGLEEDFKSIDAYDYERKEQTNEQKAWESFVRSAKEARSTDELMLTQGQKLGEFRTKATELTDILWNMYGSAGSTKKVDRVYGATLDAYLSAFFGKSISEIAENREKYKTLVMGRNVDDVSTLEAMGRAFQSDSLSTRIAMNEWMYFITKDSHYQDNVDELLKVQQSFYTDYADRNKVSETFINAMPILAQGLKMGATLLITGGIGSAIGSAVGMKKVLGDAVSASLYSTIGQKIGIGVGYGLSATDTFMREGGSAMVELSQLRDSWGNRLDDDLILKAGILTGLVNTFWEYLTPEPFTKKMTSFNFKSVLKSGFASSLGNFLLNSLAGGISESSEELLQTASSDAFSWALKKISNEYNGTTFDLSEDSLYNWLADGIKSFGQAFFPSMLVGMAGTGRAYVQDVIRNVATNEDYRKNFKTEALRTLDTYTTPENSTYNYRKEAETNQVVPSRNSRIVSEFGLSIEGGKLSKEERQQIREQYENEDGKMPAIVVKWDSSKKMYVPIDEANNKIAQYLYSDKRAKGFVIEYRNADSVHYPTSTVSILTRNNKGSFDQTNSTITFDTSRDRENFLTNFEGEIMTDTDSTTTELKVKDQDGNDVTYTVKLSEKAKQENTGVDTSNLNEDSNTTNNIRTRKVKDQDGKTYEVFDKSDVIDMISYALPSMSEREASAIAEWINLLPANIQDSIIQKLKKENGDIRDFIVSADDYAMEHNNNPKLMKKLEKGRAIALINEARIVLKDGKTRGKDVVHEVFHVLWNLFPEYRSELVKGVTITLKDTASREQLKRWYEDNRDALNSLKGNKFKNETVGQVNSWESFLSLLETVSDEKVEADIKSGNPAIEELFARMSTAILIDPSEGAINSLPSTLKDIFKKIVQKLKNLYKGLIGEFNNRNFAPRTLEDAVLSIYQDGNTYTATDNLNQRVRYADDDARQLALQMNMESNPSIDVDLLKGYHDSATVEQQTEFAIAIQNALVDENGRDIIDKHLGLDSREIKGSDHNFGIGVYSRDNEVQISVGQQNLIKVNLDENGNITESDREKLDMSCLMHSIFLRQDAVTWGYIKKSAEEYTNAIVLDVDRNLSAEEMTELYNQLDNDDYGIIANPNGAWIVNFGEGSNEDFTKQVNAVIDNLGNEWQDKLQVVYVDYDGNYISVGNWEEGNNAYSIPRERIYGEYEKVYRDCYNELQPNLQKVYDEFSEKYNWGNAGTIPTPEDVTGTRIRYSEELEGGYNNTKHMSNRAVRAYENSEMPISKWNGQALDEAIEYTSDASQEVVDILKSLPVEAKKNLLKWSSWHHTGIFFNETDFYTIGDLSDVSVKDAEIYRDEWNQYKKDKREYPKKLEEIKLGLKENQELKESYSGKMQIVTYKNAFEDVSIPSSISEFASNSLEYSRSGNAYKMFQKPNSEEVKNGLERLETSEDGKTISLTKYDADKKAYETIDSVNLPIETTTEDLHNYMKGKYNGSIVSKEDIDIKKPHAPYLYHTEEVRYSEELEDNDTQDYGDTFNVDNPKSIINRNIRTWDALVDSDVDQFIAQDVYLPTEVLKQHNSLKSVQQEIKDRQEIDLHLEVYPQIRDIASESKTVGEFIQRVKKDVYSTNLTDNDERLLRKYYNYSQTLSPTDFLSWFTEMYANEKQTTLEDLLALKKVMGIRREAKVTSNGDRVYTVVANDTRLSKLLSQIDKNSTDAEVQKTVKEIKRRAMGYMKDFARTLLRSEKASALKNTSFNPVTSSWLAIALGSSQEDAYQAHLKADSTSSEMSDATSSTDTSDTILRSLNEAINLNADEREAVVKNIQSLAKSNPFLASLVELGNMNPKEVTISMLVRAINKLEEQIDTEVLSKDDYRTRYNVLRSEIKKLNKENREQLAQINSLFKEAVGYLDKIDDYKANYKRLQKLLMYTQLFAKLDEKTLKAYYKEILARNSARTSLRNAMSYNSSTYDAYHIDPVMKYLYKFIHNTEKTFNSVSENEYVNKALKRGESTESGEVAFTTYDYVDLTSEDMGEVDVLYNPNSPRIDLSDMPSVLENALPVELANAIKNGQVTFYELDSKSLNQIRSALAIAKQLSKMSKKEKDSVRGTRRRNRAMSIFNGQYNLDVKNMSVDMKNSIIEKMNADPNYRKSSFMYSDEQIEDYIRKNPRSVFSAMADDSKGIGKKLYDAVGPAYMKMQRIAEWMDGRENGPIYNEFFRPLFESYENKMRWVNKRQADAGNVIRTILGEGNATDKKTIRVNKKLLEQEEVLKNNTVNDGEATIKVNGWDKIGIYIYSKNIFGFIKLISSSGNNIALEEVAKINPEYTKRFIELALAQREQNELVKRGLTNENIWKTSTKNDGTDYYSRDILNHVSLETLEDVLSKLNSGEIPMTSSINGISTKLGDELIRLVSARQNEVVKAGYDEYNMLTVLQDNYFPLVALDDNLFKIEEQNSKSRVSRGLLMRRQMTDTYALSLNPLANFYRAISNQEALINMASTIDDMHWLMDARGGNLKGIISQKFGTAWGKYFEEYLNAMAGAGDRNLSDLGKLANKFIGNIAISRIGANLMVSAKQLISTIPAMTQGELTPWEVLNALGKLTGNKKDSWKQFIEQQSPSTYYSAYNIEAENARKFDETMANDSVMADLREKTMWLTEKLDGLTKGAIWIAKYQKEINNGASVQDASFRATQLVQTTQSITDTPSLSQLQRNKNPLVRVAFMFTNDLFQTWNMITGDIPNAWEQGDKKRAFLEVGGIMLSNAILALLAGGWLKDDDDDDDENTMFLDFLKDWGVEFFNDVPIVGQVFDISGYDSNYYTGFDKAKNLFTMFENQATYWKTDGKKGKDYEAGEYADKLFTLVMEGGLSLTGQPVTTYERLYKSVFPNGMAEGITKSPTSFYYLLGSKWGKSLFIDK